jgi:hypothetical protein
MAAAAAKARLPVINTGFSFMLAAILLNSIYSQSDRQTLHLKRFKQPHE